MGGNATLKYGTKRLDKNTYEQVFHYFQSLFKTFENKGNFGIPASYRNKESHGDVDIVTTLPNKDFIQLLTKEPTLSFHPDYLLKVKDGVNKTIENAAVKIETADFNTPYFQLDLNFVETEYFESSLYYYSYNDLGNLLGRIAFGLGLRFGSKGLYVMLESGKYVDVLGKKIARIYLTTDYFEILKLLGFEDVDPTNFDFENIDDIYNFITQSRFFNPLSFLQAFKNGEERKRDNKRALLTQFLEKLAENEKLNKAFISEMEQSHIPFKPANWRDTLTMFEKNFGFTPKISVEKQFKQLDILLSEKERQRLERAELHRQSKKM